MRATGARTHIWNNGIKSILLLATFPVFVAAVVYGFLVLEVAVTGYPVVEGLHVALERLPATLPWVAGAVAIWFAIAFFFNVRMIALATGARPVTRAEEPLLYNLVENLCISKGMRMPKLRVIETDALNAYASGLTRRQYTVAVTRGLLDKLEPEEIEAVVAHELAHIRHGDVRLMVVAAVFVGIIGLVAEMIFRNGDVIGRMMVGGSSDRRSNKNGGGAAAMIILILIALVIIGLAYLMSIIAQMALSRTREFMADMEATLLTRNPDALASALWKISGNSEMEGVPSNVQGMFIDSSASFLGGLFATHPSIYKRIHALETYGGAKKSGRVKVKNGKMNIYLSPWG